MGIEDDKSFNITNSKLKFLETILFSNISIKEYENVKCCVELKLQLQNLLKENKFKTAYDKLFLNIENSFDKNSRRYDIDFLRLGYLFFLKLSEIDENILEKDNFSKKDIIYGFEKLEEFVLGGR